MGVCICHDLSSSEFVLLHTWTVLQTRQAMH